MFKIFIVTVLAWPRLVSGGIQLYRNGIHLTVPRFERASGGAGSDCIEACFGLGVSGSPFGVLGDGAAAFFRPSVSALSGVRPFMLLPWCGRLVL